MKRLSWINFLYTCALLVISSAIFALYIFLAVDNHFSPLAPMINGTAPRPFVYRVLAPFVIRLISDLAPIQPSLGAVLVMYLSMLGFSWSILGLARVFLPQRSAYLFSLLAPVGLIPFLFEQRHIYDFPTLFLFTLALYCLAKGYFGKYAIVFILATLSKETSLFLIAFFAIQFRKIERKRFVRLILFQIVSYGLIHLGLIALFRNNPGSLLEFHLSDHLHSYLQNPIGALILLGVVLGLFGISMLRAIDDSHFARNAFMVIGAPTLLLYFFFGVPFEIRIFLEAYPALFLLITQMLSHILSRHKNEKKIEFAG
jgi:hypothetical protein